jgi:hypothetical protein
MYQMPILPREHARLGKDITFHRWKLRIKCLNNFPIITLLAPDGATMKPRTLTQDSSHQKREARRKEVKTLFWVVS